MIIGIVLLSLSRSSEGNFVLDFEMRVRERSQKLRAEDSMAGNLRFLAGDPARTREAKIMAGRSHRVTR